MGNGPPILEYGTPDRREPARVWPVIRSFIVVVLFLVAIGLLIEIVIVGTRAYDRHQTVKRASAIQEQLSTDARYGRVKAAVFTRSGGSVFITGKVTRPGDLTALKHLVADPSSSVPIRWLVQVGRQAKSSKPAASKPTTIRTYER